MSDDKKAPWKVGEDRWSGFSRRSRYVVYREAISGRVEVASFVNKEDAELASKLVNKEDAELASKLVNKDMSEAELFLAYRMGLLLGRARNLIAPIACVFPEGSEQREMIQEWVDEVDAIKALAPPKKEGKPDEG